MTEDSNIGTFYYSVKENRLMTTINYKNKDIVIGAVDSNGEFHPWLIPVTSFDINNFEEVKLDGETDSDMYYIKLENGEKFGFRAGELSWKTYTLFMGKPFFSVERATFEGSIVGYFLNTPEGNIFVTKEGYISDSEMDGATVHGVVSLLYSRAGVFIFKKDDGGEEIRVMPKSGYYNFINSEQLDDFNKNKKNVYIILPSLSVPRAVKNDVYVIDIDNNSNVAIHCIDKTTGKVAKKKMYYSKAGENELIEFKNVDYLLKNPLYKYGSSQYPFVFGLKEYGVLNLVMPYVTSEGRVECEHIASIKNSSQEEVRKKRLLLSYDGKYVYAHQFDFTEAHKESERYSAERSKIEDEWWKEEYDEKTFDERKHAHIKVLKELEEKHHKNLQEIYSRIKIVKRFPILKFDNETKELIQLTDDLDWKSLSNYKLFSILQKKCAYVSEEEKDEW